MSKKYLRKTHLAARYHCSTRTIDRYLNHSDPARRLPSPVMSMGRTDLWIEADLDAYDERQIELGVPPRPTPPNRELALTKAADVRRAKTKGTAS